MTYNSAETTGTTFSTVPSSLKPVLILASLSFGTSAPPSTAHSSEKALAGRSQT